MDGLVAAKRLQDVRDGSVLEFLEAGEVLPAHRCQYCFWFALQDRLDCSAWHGWRHRNGSWFPPLGSMRHWPPLPSTQAVYGGTGLEGAFDSEGFL